jgi:ribonuclease Z
MNQRNLFQADRSNGVGQWPRSRVRPVVSHAFRARRRARKAATAALERTNAMAVILCGTGRPLPSQRAQSCTVVFAGGQCLVFDVGNGAVRSMEALDVPLAHVHAIFLTHFHSDHIADLGEIIDRSWLTGRREQLYVYGPERVTEIVNGYMAAYNLEYGYRTAHHGAKMLPPHAVGATAIAFTAPVDEEAMVVYEQGGIVVKSFKVNHSPVIPAVGYRIEYAGRVVVISGDTTVTNTLLTYSRGADVLVSEVMNKALIQQMEVESRSSGLHFNAAILHDVLAYHMDVSDVGNLAQQAQVKRLALTHLIPPLDNRVLAKRFFRHPIRKRYHGEIFLGKDGTHIVIPLQ